MIAIDESRQPGDQASSDEGNPVIGTGPVAVERERLRMLVQHGRAAARPSGPYAARAGRDLIGPAGASAEGGATDRDC